MFAGRESELQELTAFAREALAGKAGVLFISGEAGMGKTTLVMELLRRLAGEYPTLVTLSKKCTLEGASYLPFRGILEELVERRGEVNISGEIGRKSDKVKDTVLSVIKDVGTDVLGVFLPQTVAGITEKGVLSVFGQLFSKRQKDLGGLVAPKDLEQIQVFGWYTRVMKNIADKFPLALFIDDLHWADTSSLNLLLHLGRELEGSRILVIGTYRSHDVAPNALLTQITAKLGRYGAKIFSLDVAQEQPSAQQRAAQFVRDYLASRYQTNFSDRFERLLTDRTEGNALFLTELLKNMEEKGEIQPHPQPLSEGEGRTNAPPLRGGDGGGVTWRLTAQIAGLADLPERVEQTIKERVDRVTQFSKTLAEILECASVEGDDFIAQVVATVKERDDMQVLDELTEQLMSAYQLIYERGGKSLANGSRIHEFAFKHNLIREYVYQHLSKTKRELLHVKIGECLETLYAPNADDIAAQLAVHFYHGHVPEKAVGYGLKAAQDANARYGAAEAVRFAKMGLEALETRKAALPPNEYAETKIRLLLELAKAEKNGGDLQEQKDHIQAGIVYLEENFLLLNNVSEKLQADFYTLLGLILFEKNKKNSTKVKGYLEKAKSIYETYKDWKNMADILHHLAYVYWCIPNPDEKQNQDDKAIETVEQGLSIAQQIQDISLQITYLSQLVWYYDRFGKDFPRAEQRGLEALRLSKIHGRSLGNADIRALDSTEGVCRRYARYKKGIEFLKEALQLAEQRGDILSEALLLNTLGRSYGFYVTLQRAAEEILEKNLSIKEKLGYVKSSVVLGEFFLKQGKWKDAKEHFQTALLDSSERGQLLLRHNFAQFYMLSGDYIQAQREFLIGLDAVAKYRLPIELIACVEICLNYLMLGNISECRCYMKLAQTRFEQDTRPAIRWEYLYKISEVHRILKELDTAKLTCQQSIEAFLTHADDPENLIAVAEARLIMGKILVDMGEHQDAIEYLEKAKTAFDICQHYALGETLLYLGKAHVGLGGVILRRQGKEYVTQALAEFERLELQHKASEARELLKELP